MRQFLLCKSHSLRLPGFPRRLAAPLASIKNRTIVLFIFGALWFTMTGGPACIAQVRNGDRIAVDPHLTYAAAERRTQEFQQLDLEEARAHPALENPENGADWNDRGVLEARLQRLAAAEQAFQQAITLAPAESLPYYNLSRLYALLGEDDRARKIYARLVQQGGLDGARLYERAIEMSAGGRLREARWMMQSLADQLPARAPEAAGSEQNVRSGLAPAGAIEAALWLAADAMHALDYGRARSEFDRVLTVSPRDARALFGRGYISYLAQDWPAAAHLLGLARSGGSTEPGLPYYLTRALFEEERYDEALAVARAAPEPDLQLLTMHGRIRLILDYRADLSDLLARARPADRPRLQQVWYGSPELRKLPELGGEFEFLY